MRLLLTAAILLLLGTALIFAQPHLQPEIDSAEADDEKIYETVEEMPQFPGAEAAMLQWIASHINYNGCDTIQGRVILTFVVRKDGTVGSVKVIRPLHPDLDNEAIRVVKTLPAFTPGKMNGIPVNVWYTLPISFRIPDPQD